MSTIYYEKSHIGWGHESVKHMVIDFICRAFNLRSSQKQPTGHKKADNNWIETGILVSSGKLKLSPRRSV